MDEKRRFVVARHPIWTAAALVAVALALLIDLWDWDWLRPVAASWLASEIGRPVTIGHFGVQDILSGRPVLVLDQIAIGNPPDFPANSELGRIASIAIRINAQDYIASGGSRLFLPEVTIDHPQGDLRPGPKGNPNWVFGIAGASSNPPRIGALTVTDGNFRIAVPKLQADVALAIRTEAKTQGHEAKLIATARGTYGGQPLTASFTGGSLLSLRDAKDPYPVDFEAKNGQTEIKLTGTLSDPLTLGGGKLHLDLAGQDLADLYAIIGIPLAQTAPYHLVGQLDYGGNHIRFHRFEGTVGNSDLGGDFDVDRGWGRPLITADLTSRNLALADLAGFIGTAPGKAGVVDPSPKHQAEKAQRAASADLFPDQPIDLSKLRTADYFVRYKATHFQSDWTPLDSLSANLKIWHGQITLQPLSFGVGTGSVSSTIEIDANANPLAAKADIDFRQVDFHRLLAATGLEGAGVIGGRAILDGRGNSLAQILGHGNGDLKLFMDGGEINALVLDLIGLDFGRSLLSGLGMPKQATIRCMIGDYALTDGVLETRAFVIDTNEANIVGAGTVNLRNETLDYQIKSEPKHFSIGSLHTPIDLTGLLKSPTIKPDPAALGLRIGLAAVLGATLTPLGALLPTIELGLGKDSNCATLVHPAAAAAGRENQAAAP